MRKFFSVTRGHANGITQAQMHSFEKGWGWLYWTWDTESSAQWSYAKGLAAGILPEKAYDRDFDCDSDVPDFAGLPETY
jgi:glucan 1,3-beta-glucosidase